MLSCREAVGRLKSHLRCQVRFKGVGISDRIREIGEMITVVWSRYSCNAFFLLGCFLKLLILCLCIVQAPC